MPGRNRKEAPLKLRSWIEYGVQQSPYSLPQSKEPHPGHHGGCTAWTQALSQAGWFEATSVGVGDELDRGLRDAPRSHGGDAGRHGGALRTAPPGPSVSLFGTPTVAPPVASRGAAGAIAAAGKSACGDVFLPRRSDVGQSTRS